MGLTLSVSGTDRRLILSGDIGNPNTLLMPDPQVPESADWVIMESTYGDRDHKPIQDTQEELAQILAAAGEQPALDALAKGLREGLGVKVLIPHRGESFELG